MPNYVVPDVVQKFSGVKVDLWHWLEKNIGNREDSFEIDQGKLADRFNVSRTSIINALKTFISANLVEKVDTGKGRGNHCQYRLKWTFKTENELKCNPSHVYSKPQEKSLTKGRLWRYFAYKFRTLVEDSSLSHKSQVVVGKLLNYLEGKPPEVFRQWLIYLRNWLDYPRTLKDFFVYFHQTLIELARDKLSIIRQQWEIERERERKKEIRQEYQNNPPPKSSDFARFSDYLEAIEAWESPD